MFSGWILTWVWICCFVSYAIRKIYIWTISNSRDNNFHHDCYKLYIIISWVAICIFMQFNISFKTIFEYILKKLVLCIQIRFVSTEKTTRIASRASCLYNKTALVSSNYWSRISRIHFLSCDICANFDHVFSRVILVTVTDSRHPFPFLNLKGKKCSQEKD